jgi:fumarylacetoacetate (FAA) hydrolase
MKLATIRNGTRDGTLHVVSRDLRRMADASAVARSLQQALDDPQAWPGLARLSAALDSGALAGAAFDQAQASAPLPRAYQWLDASAFPSHGRLMQRAFGFAPDMHADAGVLMYQGASDAFIGPRDDILVADEAAGIDFEAEVGVIVDDVPMGADAETAAASIRLLVLLNDVSLRACAPAEMRTGFGFLHAKPATAFAPVAITPDEAAGAWRDGRLHLPVDVSWNGAVFGRPHAGEMAASFPELIAWIARTRRLAAGTVIGSGTVSNASYAEVGSACIAERRAIEAIELGAPRTGFMRFGDTVRIGVRHAGEDLFGTIEQSVARHAPGREAA